jgi:pimeloyl-ACP methyl ester carboxylesterase
MEAARAGEHRLAAELYVEGVASCPGSWQYLPDNIKQGFIANAAAFLADAGGLQGGDRLPQELERLGHGVVVTTGSRTSPYIKLVMNRLYSTLPGLRRHVFGVGGHVPHQTCPDEFVAKTLEFATARLGR